MGFFDDDIIEEVKHEFTPLDLNEGNVQAIFNRCLATEDTKEYIKSVLEQKEHGFAKDSMGILFDRKKIQRDNIHAIAYLYGQLLTTHDDSNTINTSTTAKSNVMKKYTGEIWTTNKGILMQLFHLGLASGLIYYFLPMSDSVIASSFTCNIRPTLSPKDPNFLAWWEEHKSEWEN